MKLRDFSRQEANILVGGLHGWFLRSEDVIRCRSACTGTTFRTDVSGSLV
jgi:hypothetical protein